MKKAVLIGSILLAAQAFAGFSTRGGMKAPLAVQVRFISIGTGINMTASRAINAMIKLDKQKGDLVKVVKTGKGMEGEYTLCLQYKDVRSAYKAQQQIAAIADQPRSLVSYQKALFCGYQEVDGNRR